MNNPKLTKLLNDINSGDAPKVIHAAGELASLRELHAVPRMLEILRETDDAAVRNALALALSDLKEPAAFDVLVDLVKSERTIANRGTLLYALGAFDCSPILPLLVGLVIDGNYEVSRQAFALIQGVETELDEHAWQMCHDRLQVALDIATEERRPLLEELKKLFDGDE